MLLILSRAFIIWIILIVTEILQGIIRLRFLVRRIGDKRARQWGVLSGSLLNFIIITLSIRWIGAVSTQEQWIVGVWFVLLTFVFEVLFGRVVIGYSWKRIWEDFNLKKGGVLGIGFFAMLLSPWIAAKMLGIQ